MSATARGQLAEAAVLLALALAQLDHPGRHQQAARRGVVAQHAERGGGALRVGVVGVVDHDDAGRSVDDRREPVVGRGDLAERARHVGQRQPLAEPDGGGRQQVRRRCARRAVSRAPRRAAPRRRRRSPRSDDDRRRSSGRPAAASPPPTGRPPDAARARTAARGRRRGCGRRAGSARRRRASTNRPSAGIESASSPFACSVTSSEPNRSRWAGPIAVSTPARGWTRSQRSLTSPRAVGAHLDDERLVRRLQALVDRAHDAELRVERGRRRIRRAEQVEHRRHARLRRRLAVGAGDADDERSDVAQALLGSAHEAAVVGLLDRSQQPC